MNGIVFLALATVLCCVAAGWTTLRRRAADRAKSKEMRSRIRKRYTPPSNWIGAKSWIIHALLLERIRRHEKKPPRAIVSGF